MDRVRATLEKLTDLSDPSRLTGRTRYGIATEKALGVAVPDLRRMVKSIGVDHELALSLWGSRIHEARMLASMIDDPDQVTDAQMEAWVHDFDSWDLCDQVCANLFDRTRYAFRKAVEWSSREEEFVKRAGFALMAGAAVHRKDAADATFEAFLPIIQAAATDDRNYVKKAVNWSLRQIGKRSPRLNRESIATAKQIRKIDARSARWIASDAIRELQSPAVQQRLRGSARPTSSGRSSRSGRS